MMNSNLYIPAGASYSGPLTRAPSFYTAIENAYNVQNPNEHLVICYSKKNGRYDAFPVNKIATTFKRLTLNELVDRARECSKKLENNQLNILEKNLGIMAHRKFVKAYDENVSCLNVIREFFSRIQNWFHGLVNSNYAFETSAERAGHLVASLRDQLRSHEASAKAKSSSSSKRSEKITPFALS